MPEAGPGFIYEDKLNLIKLIFFYFSVANEKQGFDLCQM
jgi:hypothetical protein